MRYVLDHAPKGKSYVANLDSGDEEVQVLKDDDAKDAWAHNLGENDEVWTLFGVSDNVSLVLYDCGVKVYRISGYYLPKELKGTSRKAEFRRRVLAELGRLAVEKQELWYKYRPLDAGIAAVRANVRCFYTVQEKIRKRSEQFLSAAYRERYLVDPLRHELTIDQFIKRQLADDPVFEVIKEKEKYWLGEIKRSLKGIPMWEKVLKGDRFRGFGPALSASVIGETGDIRRFPNRDAYVAYCGCHVIPARDFLQAHGIRYEMARRKAGEVANWQQKLRQAFWKWSFVQVPKMAAQEKYADDPWCKLYLDLKAREVQKRIARGIPEEGIVIPNPRQSSEEDDEENGNGENGGRGQRYLSPLHLHKRACAKLRTLVVRKIYSEWNKLVEAGEM